MNKFWNKIDKCKHVNLDPNYFEVFNCATPGCIAIESRCLDCGAFIVTCGCGYENMISGWSMYRWRRFRLGIKKINVLRNGGK